jgi:hypothetical protein
MMVYECMIVYDSACQCLSVPVSACQCMSVSVYISAQQCYSVYNHAPVDCIIADRALCNVQ